MKALVGAFNQEKALVGAFSVIVKTDCETDGSFYSTSIMFEIVQKYAQILDRHMIGFTKTFFSRETYWKVLKQNRIYIVSFSVLWWKLHFKFLDWKWLKFPLKAPVNFHYFQVLVLQTFL